MQHVRDRILHEVQGLEPYPAIIGPYQDALHNAEIEAMLATFDKNGIFNGHGEHTDLRQGLGMWHLPWTRRDAPRADPDVRADR